MKFIDLTGQQFGRLTVIRYSGKDKFGHSQWLCKCDCGNKKILSSPNFKNGSVRSCGCIYEETIIKNGYINYNNENFRKANDVDRFRGTKICSLNKKAPKNNTSGYKGVSWNKKTNKWISRIQLAGEGIYLGQYYKLDDAINARREAEEKYYSPIIEEYERKNNLYKYSKSNGNKNGQTINIK
ncbi:TPA: hypothetical protein ACX96Z_000476 [Clostridium sporogenes]